MALLDELRDVARQLTDAQLPSAAEQRIILAALIYYIDTRLNLERPPAGTDLVPEEMRDWKVFSDTARPSNSDASARRAPWRADD